MKWKDNLLPIKHINCRCTTGYHIPISNDQNMKYFSDDEIIDIYETERIFKLYGSDMPS